MVIVKVSVVNPLVRMIDGENAFTMLGVRITPVTDALAIPFGPVFVPDSVAEMFPVVLVIRPDLMIFTFTLAVQLLFAAREPSEKSITTDPADALKTAPVHVVLAAEGDATIKPSGRKSVNWIPLSVVDVLGLVIVKVSVVVPFTTTDGKPKTLAMVGGDGGMGMVVAVAVLVIVGVTVTEGVMVGVAVGGALGQPLT